MLLKSNGNIHLGFPSGQVFIAKWSTSLLQYFFLRRKKKGNKSYYKTALISFLLEYSTTKESKKKNKKESKNYAPIWQMMRNSDYFTDCFKVKDNEKNNYPGK